MSGEDSLDLSDLNEDIRDELELLKEIFFKEIHLFNRNEELEVKVSLTPSTGDRWDLKYVFLDLIIRINKMEYPDTKPPRFELNKVRGISQDHQERILNELSELAASRLGENILYELIEFVQEELTQNNMPAGNCPICLESFSGYCHFTITECTHYFHMACLNEHLKHLDKTDEGFTEPRCPSCREILDDDYVEALQRNTNELGLKCNLHKAGKEKLVMSPALREQTRKYKEMFEAMYLKQKANNSFFTGDTHVLDLTSRSVVAQSLQNVVQQQQEVVPTREEVPTTSSEKSTPTTVENPLQDKPDESDLIISFSNLLEQTTPDPNNLSQDKLGSTCSTAPSNIEDSQSELSVSLSHQSELSTSLSHESVQHVEKDDLCYTEDELEDKELTPVDVADSSTVQLSDEDNAAESFSESLSEYTSFAKETKIVNIEEETPEQIDALQQEEEKEKVPNVVEKEENLPVSKEDETKELNTEEENKESNVEEETKEETAAVEEVKGEVEPAVEKDTPEDNEPESQLENLPEEKAEESENLVKEDEIETVTIEDVIVEESEKVPEDSESIENEVFVENVEPVSEIPIEEESSQVTNGTQAEDSSEVLNGSREEEGIEEEEEDEVSEVSVVTPSKTVSFSEDAKTTGTQSESREIQTQTRRVKRNRNRRRSNNREGQFRPDTDSGRGGGRGGYNNHHQHQHRGGYNNNRLPTQDGEVVYRRPNRGRGGNRGENCRSYHEGVVDEHGRNKQEYRRHSFSEHSQNWRSDQQPGDKRHQRPRDYYQQQQPPQQPRFKPPRILRQEALAQAKKLSQALSNQEQLTPNMHKIPVSLYNPSGGNGGPPSLGPGPPSFPPVFHGYQMTQIPPHMYQQAATSNYHHGNTRKPTQPSSDPRVTDPRITDPRAPEPRHKMPPPPSSRPPPPSSSRPGDLPSLSSSSSLSKPGIVPGSTNKALSPTSHNKIFDVSRFQQSILRNNTSPTSSGSNK